MNAELIYFTDLKSPFAYLVMDDLLALEERYGVTFRWVHFTLHIPEFLGAVETRSENEWRKVKYAYMDARRLANRKGLTVLGPKKIFDSRPAGIGLTYAEEQGLLHAYARRTFEKFFHRELDPGVVEEVKAVLAEVGADTAGFDDWYTGEGAERHERERQLAIDMGVFGVPTFAIDGELFWGGDRLWMVEERLQQLAA
ncbi:2-hydroxychromene-2-carboxylate isomerase [Minwuia thermotolerans]|uniref:2-hydroxychromene-2-carboxylate isomerase n=1 Tax=Minwuia thermotolerans TaxID=2056226 RepID=A0A2M9G2D1_9PROT|nr:DsbA family protein [Minwuia thermotolerans]PJK29836.1 disulfide bond formation protein DsbA [Minwuia thermotolerans]